MSVDLHSGIGVSGGVGRGILVEYDPRVAPGPTSVIILTDLDKRVAHAASAAAIVSLDGGITSHGAVLARELKLPCVVFSKAKSIITDVIGLQVEVNGWEGTVSILHGE